MPATLALVAQSSTSADGATVGSTALAGWTVGRIAVAELAVSGGSGTTVTPPTGFTLLYRVDQGTTVSKLVYTKTVDAATMDCRFAMSPNASAVLHMIQVAGGNPNSQAASYASADNVSSTSQPLPMYTTGRPMAEVLAGVAEGIASTYTTPTGWTEFAVGSSSGGASNNVSLHTFHKREPVPVSAPSVEDVAGTAGAGAVGVLVVADDAGQIERFLTLDVPDRMSLVLAVA